MKKISNRIPARWMRLVIIGGCLAVFAIFLTATKLGDGKSASLDAEIEMRNAAREIITLPHVVCCMGGPPDDFSEIKRCIEPTVPLFPSLKGWLNKHAFGGLPWPSRPAFERVEISVLTASGEAAPFVAVWSPASDSLRIKRSDASCRLALRHRDFNRSNCADPAIHSQSFPDPSVILFDMATGLPATPAAAGKASR